MISKRFYLLTAAIMVFSMILAACAPQPAATTVAPPEKISTFIFGRGGDSVQLDPSIVTDGESFRVTGQCIENLYAFKHGTTTPEPALATGCTANEDGTEWTCSLREGVKFHDGTDFNADAVIFNFERWRFTDNPYHFESQVFEYYEAQFGGFDDASIITSIDKVDDHTIKFNLAAPQAPFLNNLAMDMFAISSPKAIMDNGEKYGTPSVGCVGTGPYKFVEWVEGDHITVTANDDYWAGRAKTDQIVWKVIPDDSARFLALKSGDIQGLETATVEDLASAASDPDLQIMTRPALNTGYLAFNYKIKEFQDVRVREAVARAINKANIVENFLGKYGIVAKSFLPPAILGFPEAMEDLTYDPELSKQLLADAGFPNGLSEVTIAEDVADADGNVVFTAGSKMPLRFYYMPVTRFYYPSPKEIGEAMAADLAKAGITTEMYLEGDWSTYLGSRRNGLLMGLYMLGWGGDNGDPDNFLCYFFCTATEPIAREGWYQNAEIVPILLKAQATVDPAARAAMYTQVEEMLQKDVARIWVDHYNTPLILSSKVSGYIPQPVGADIYEFVVVAE